MIGYKQTLLVFLFMILPGVTLIAQNNTNSPYTRYGFGQLVDQGSGNSKAMGGIAYGLRDKSHVNFANPASYTAIDSLTFIFDGGISLQNTNFDDGTMKRNAKNSSFDYVAMQFRLAKWAGMSIGLLPYSNVGYSMSQYYENPGSTEHSTTVTYSGDGGLHQLYVGLGFKIFKNLSVGTNISYLWGDITHNRTQSFPQSSTDLPVRTIANMAVKSYKVDVGVQYTQQFGKKHEATIGATFSPGHDLNNDASVQHLLGTSETGVTGMQNDTTMTCGIPMTIGVGVAYKYDNRLTVGADFTYQKWSSVDLMNQTDALCDRTKIAVGAEFIPNLMGRNYLAYVRYRVGAYYSQPYYKIEGSRASREYGVTAGFGLPIPRTRSVVSLSAQYVHTKGLGTTFLTENTLRLCIGITFNERWFFKRKVD